MFCVCWQPGTLLGTHWEDLGIVFYVFDWINFPDAAIGCVHRYTDSFSVQPDQEVEAMSPGTGFVFLEGNNKLTVCSESQAPLLCCQCLKLVRNGN